MSLRLLHLSDIHFHDDDESARRDRDLHDEVIRTVRQDVLSGHPIDAILVGGDIAFSARSNEYLRATEWLARLREVCGGLDASRVWVIPGNHDVDWNVVQASGDITEFRQSLSDCHPAAVDQKLFDRVVNDPAGESLLLPFAEYNRFARTYFCDTSARALAWEDQSMSLGEWKVKLTGLNSSVNSGPGDTKPSLVVGLHQARLSRSDGIVQIAMVHHPPAWIKDWGHIEPYLNRAHLVLFGHEHAFEATQTVQHGSVRVSAGAVSPERDEAGEVEPYMPTFNIITLSQADGRVQIDVDPRTWNIPKTRFEPHLQGPKTFWVDLDPAVEEPNTVAEGVDGSAFAESISSSSPLINTEEARVDTPPSQGPDERRSLRAIGVEFLSLPVMRRLQIAQTLGVLEESEMNEITPEIYPLILRRVRDADKVEELIEEMDR